MLSLAAEHRRTDENAGNVSPASAGAECERNSARRHWYQQTFLLTTAASHYRIQLSDSFESRVVALKLNPASGQRVIRLIETGRPRGMSACWCTIRLLHKTQSGRPCWGGRCVYIPASPDDMENNNDLSPQPHSSRALPVPSDTSFH